MYISMTMWGEASEGAGNRSVQSSEKADAHVPSPCSAQPVAGFCNYQVLDAATPETQEG